MSDEPLESGLADTSVFIAHESGRELAALPARVAVSVVTLGELRLGVLASESRTIRARRADTLALAARADPIPISEAVMIQWAELVASCRRADVGRGVKQNDVLIAATALEHGLPVLTQDDDFDALAKAHPALDVIRV